MAADIAVADPFDEDLRVASEPHSEWSLETETLRLSPGELRAKPEAYVAECIELRSRIFSATEDWQAEVQKVMDTLIRVQNSLPCRFITNSSTGLHVHIGNSLGQKIPFQTAKNVLTVMTAFEHCLDEIHPADRIAHPTKYDLGFCHAPISFFHRANGQTGPEAGLLDWLANIQRKGSYESLGQLFCIPDPSAFPDMVEKNSYGHNSSLNLENLFPDESESRWAEELLKGTIEFRQHAGTLQALEICAWTTLVASIVLFCHEVSDAGLLALCAQAVDSEYTLRNLQVHIGCAPDLIKYYAYPGVMYDVVDPRRPTLFPPGSSASLVQQNRKEEAERFDPKAVVGAITSKDRGLRETVCGEVPFPMDAVARCYHVACAKTASMGFDIFRTQAEIAIPARGLVFEHMAKVYRGIADPDDYWCLS